MSIVSKQAPDFSMPSTRDLDNLGQEIKLSDYRSKWLVLFFYPLDFTFVCPTELTAFSDRIEEFRSANADILGVSVDSVYSHKAWLDQSRSAGGIGNLKYTLGSDITKKVSRDYGVLLEDQGIALRGLFLIDPDGIVRYEVVSDLNVGRSVAETLRVLQAFQTGGLCPIDWQPGDRTL